MVLPRIASTSPLHAVVMVACAALGALVTNVEYLTTTSTTDGGGVSSSFSPYRGGRVVGTDGTTTTTFDTTASVAKSGTGRSRDSLSRIQYRLVHGRPYQQRYGLKYACDPNATDTRPLPDELQQAGMVDFQTEIATSLKIAVVGDSIGVQIGHRLEESMMMLPASSNRYAYVETNWNNLVLTFPVRGGGALLSYRVNGLLWDEMSVHRHRHRLLLHERRRQPSSPQQHRFRRQLQNYFKPQRFNRTEVDAVLQRPVVPLTTMDAVVQRITYPWVHLHQITYESLSKNAHMAINMFGMETLVLVNFYFSNNVLDALMHRQFRQKLDVVRNFSKTFVPPANSTLQRVLLLDLDRLVDQFNEVNARTIGFDTQVEPFDSWMLSQTLGPYNPKAYFRKHVAQVCGERVPNHTDACPHNMFFVDGLHFCPSTFTGRVTAGIACLLECAENDRRDFGEAVPTTTNHDGAVHEPDTPGASQLRACERSCNDKYMSLQPIPLSEMVHWEDNIDFA